MVIMKKGWEPQFIESVKVILVTKFMEFVHSLMILLYRGRALNLLSAIILLSNIQI